LRANVGDQILVVFGKLERRAHGMERNRLMVIGKVADAECLRPLRQALVPLKAALRKRGAPCGFSVTLKIYFAMPSKRPEIRRGRGFFSS
jgi:hypothetical protein